LVLGALSTGGKWLRNEDYDTRLGISGTLPPTTPSPHTHTALHDVVHRNKKYTVLPVKNKGVE
jgi:hypothetical protein